MTFRLNLSDEQVCDGVIFDLDGTLWDSTFAISCVWSKEFGKPIPMATIRSCMGLTADAISQRIGASVKQLAEVQHKENDYLWRYGGQLYPKVYNTLAILRERGISCFIVSNCQAGYVECFVHRHAMGQFFRSWRTSAAGSKSENIGHLLTAYGISRPLVVGDHVTDYEAAVANQLPMVQALYGFGESLTGVTGLIAIDDLLALMT
jgi:phosphoglycolate phosphatase